MILSKFRIHHNGTVAVTKNHKIGCSEESTEMIKRRLLSLSPAHQTRGYEYSMNVPRDIYKENIASCHDY